MRFSLSALLLFSFSHIDLQAQLAVLALSSANASPATTVTLDLTWASSGVSASGLQWTLTYPAANVSAVSVQAGPVLTAASKTLTCAASAGKQTCLAVGINSTVIPVGVAARVVLTLTPSATTSILAIGQPLAVSALGVPITVSGVSGTITLNAAAAPTLSGLACSPTSLIAPATATCTVTLAAPAAAATTLALSSSHSAISVPATVTLPSGAAAATFTASSTAVTAQQQATVSATLGTVTKTATLTVQPAPAAVSVLQCGASTLVSGGSVACSIALTAAAPAGGAPIALSASSSVITVPNQVTVPAGATSTGFTANAATVSASQTVTLTASLNGLAKTFAIAVLPPGTPLFRLAGEPSELQGGAVNNATVAPAINTVALPGKLVIAGSGSAAFASAYLGNGVRFGPSGAQNLNTAFYRFTGTALANLLGRNQGDISFYLKSAYSFAERSADPSDNLRWTFDAYDATVRRFTFCVLVSGGRLLFLYQAAGAPLQTYLIPPGQENAVFGKSVIAKIRLHWDGSKVNLFVNEVSVHSAPYTPVTANWTAASSFTIGAVEARDGSAGFYASDDLIDEFEIHAPEGSQPPPAPPALPALSAVSCAASTLPSGTGTSCSVALAAAAPAGGAAIALSTNSSAISVPNQLSVPAGATSAAFTASASAVVVNQTVTVTATFNGVTKTDTIAVLPPGAPLFHLAGESSELQGGAVNNATVAPALNALAPAGKLVIAGSGSAAFASAYLGNGVRFGPSGAQNLNTAFYRFTGTALANLLGRNQGDISFYLKSAYSFAERSADASDNIRWTFDAYDATARQFTFCVLVSGGRLLFLYQAAGAPLQTYLIPPGQENAVFGKSVIAKIRLHWDGSKVNLFVNDVSVHSAPYTPVTANWTAASSFTIGAVESRQGAAGYYASDDLIDEFEIR